MRRGSWILAGSLVFLGLLFLLAAGLGLHSKSMMGMMKSGHGMMSMSGLMWTMGLWSTLILLVFFAALIVLFFLSYRFTNRGSEKCPNCQATVQNDWSFCPECGSHLKCASEQRH